MKLYYLLASALLLTGCAESPSVTSPDGNIRIDISREGASLTYNVSVGGEQLIMPSRLGFDADGLTPAEDAKMTVTHSSFDETWQQPWGENKEIRNHYN
ncbi:MAG: glycoside hydrolase family 97 N-terminal domain-containing protein, partial [Muribaculaceae bacterium]|nr:glycoside hydrolase family 97 N-terminal domain-containing protein [Muribaculaceae bacterium]